MPEFLDLCYGGSTNACCRGEFPWWEPFLDFFQRLKYSVVLGLFVFLSSPLLPLCVHNRDVIGTSFPQFPNGVPLPSGIHSGTEREVFQFLCFSEIVNQGVYPGGGLSRSTRAVTTHCFHTGHCGWAADSNNLWQGLHWHMWSILIQIIVYSTPPFPLYLLPRRWNCLPCLSAKKIFCFFGNWGRRARVADL